MNIYKTLQIISLHSIGVSKFFKMVVAEVVEKIEVVTDRLQLIELLNFCTPKLVSVWCKIIIKEIKLSFLCWIEL